MYQHKKKSIGSIILKSLFLLTFLLINNINSSAADKKWEVFEIQLTAQNKYTDPYVDGLLHGEKGLVQMVFTGISGEAKDHEYIVTGFWDGDQIWKVRFAPPLSGSWSYESISDDPGLNGIEGTFKCEKWSEREKDENPARRGFVRVCNAGQRKGHYFEYTDGTPFLWIGDTWWGWSNKDIYYSSFKGLVDNRVEKGFTIGQLYIPINQRTAWSSRDTSDNALNIIRLRKIDERIQYANSKGMTMWIHGWWARRDLDKRVSGEELMRWTRYLVHRYAAYNVIWTLCGEYTLYDFSGFGLQFWNDVGAMVDAEDPYQRISSTHANPSMYVFPDSTETPYYSTAPLLHDESWLDYNQIQVGHSKWRNEMIPTVVAEDYALIPAKPVVVTEPWYEFLEGDPVGDSMEQIHTNIVEEIIFGAWSAVLSGAAGHSYGGGHVWRAHLPETPRIRAGTWPMDMSFNTATMDYPGACAIGHMARFLKNIDWWELEPHPELISVYPQKFCSAVPGSEYLIFMRYGGGLKLDLSPSSADDIFGYTWFDPRTGETHSKGTVTGGGTQNFIAPGIMPNNPYMWQPIGWVLYVKKI